MERRVTKKKKIYTYRTRGAGGEKRRGGRQGDGGEGLGEHQARQDREKEVPSNKSNQVEKGRQGKAPLTSRFWVKQYTRLELGCGKKRTYDIIRKKRFQENRTRL